MIPKLPGEIWDADLVLNYMVKMPSNYRLSNLQLSEKCIVLLMLASRRHKADIMALDVSPAFMKKTSDTYYCAMSKVSKGNSSCRNNFMQFIKFHKFDKQPKVCPYKTLQDYISRVRSSVDKSQDHTKLFVTTTTGSPAHRDTVSRWAFELLDEAGVSIHQPHSIHSASSSKSIQYKEPIENVMARCGWTQKSTFYTHYLWPVAMGEKPSTSEPNSDFEKFFAPPKLLTDKTKAIPQKGFILSSDMFVTNESQLPSPHEVDFLPVLPPTSAPASVTQVTPDPAPPVSKPAEDTNVIDLTTHSDEKDLDAMVPVEPVASPSSSITLKTDSGTCIISPFPTSSVPVSPTTSTATVPPASTPLDQLSPSNFLEIHNRRILERKIITQLPPAIREFKRKKLAAKHSIKRAVKTQCSPKQIDTPPPLVFNIQTTADQPPTGHMVQEKHNTPATPVPAHEIREKQLTLATTAPPPQPVEKPKPEQATAPKVIKVLWSPKGPIEVLVKKVSFPSEAPAVDKKPLIILQPPVLLERPCPTTAAPDVPLPQFASFMQAAAGGYSEIKFLFSHINLDRRVLFGDNLQLQVSFLSCISSSELGVSFCVY